MNADDFEPDEDRMQAARRWNAYLDEIDREIADEQRPEVIEERKREAAARDRWRNLPPVRLRGGTNGPRTEQEEALADRLGY
jgi:hypothetical protein